MKNAIILITIFTILSLTSISFSNDNLIVTGERIGPYILNKTLQKDVIGKKGEIMKIMNKRREFADKGLLFIFKNSKELTRVTTLNSNYSTKRGLKVGSTIEDVKKIGAVNLIV